MKSYILLGVIFLFAIFMVSYVFAISTQIKPKYTQGETIMTKISGNILSPIKSGNVILKRGHVEVPFQYGIQKLGGDYYLWGIAPYEKNTYTLDISGIQTMVSGAEKTITYETNFSVSKNVTDYNIQPGAFLAHSGTVQILTATNFGDNALTVSSGFANASSVVLQPGKNTIKITIGNSLAGLYNFTFGAYTLPVYVANSNGDRSRGEIQGTRFSVKPIAIGSVIITNETRLYPIEVFNLANQSISVFVRTNESIFSIVPSGSFTIPAGGGFNLNLTLRNITKNVSGDIYFNSREYTIKIPVTIHVTDNINSTTPYTDNGNQTVLDSCSSLGGFVCSASGETCQGTTQTSLDGACCIGQCVASQNSGESYAWIGYLLGGILLIGSMIIIVWYRKMGSKGVALKKELEAAKKVKIS